MRNWFLFFFKSASEYRGSEASTEDDLFLDCKPAMAFVQEADGVEKVEQVGFGMLKVSQEAFAAELCMHA